MKNKIIGLFGGTFDPVHNGHLYIAKKSLELSLVDKVLFCPTGQNPLKRHAPYASSEDRLSMLKLAIAPYSDFDIWEGEIYKPQPSFTIHTLEELKKRYPDSSTRLILGSDAIPSFHLWKRATDLLELAPPIIFCRSDEDPFLDYSGDPKLKRLLESKIVHIPVMDISSTEIRILLKKGESIERFTPPEVVDYIYSKRLYST